MINNSSMELSTVNQLPNLSENQKNKKRIEQLELQLELIKERNTRVEADKAWEVSAFRIACICAITYLVAALVLYLIGAKRYWLDAFVPPIGFFLSTQSLPVIKRWWIASQYKKNRY